jgi:hypothetical protein
MKLKPYQMQVAAGFACATLLAVLHQWASSKVAPSLFTTLEAASFGFCCLGMITAGRAVRQRLLDVGSDKLLARTNPSYMIERRNTQIACIFGCSALVSLLAARYGQNPILLGLSALLLLTVAMPFMNRATGWQRVPAG